MNKLNFKAFKQRLQANFNELVKDQTHLFQVSLDKDVLWNLYLDSFPAGTNDVFRERRSHDCSCCRHFIKNIGTAVVVKDEKIHTIWDFDAQDPVYQVVIDTLDAYIKTATITDIFFSRTPKVGVDFNFEKTDGDILEWQHFYVEVPERFVNTSGKSMGDLYDEYGSATKAFRRSLQDISEDAILTVLELISSNSLYKGAEWKTQLESFLIFKHQFDSLVSQGIDTNTYIWTRSISAGPVISRIRGKSIGTLLKDISSDMDLEMAVKRYETIVAGPNYKRPKEIYTQRMLDAGKKELEEKGYLDFLHRRMAHIDDITVNNVLFANRDARSRMYSADVFGEMSKGLPVNPKKFKDNVAEITYDKFVDDVLPLASTVEVLVENRHAKQMMTLIAPKIKEAKSMLAWDNSFSWAYAGNLTDSAMKERVKSHGGSITGDLRFSIQWNDKSKNNNDLDAHCEEITIHPPRTNNYRIFFENKNKVSPNGGVLDVDITHPATNGRDAAAVENITYASRSTMANGLYNLLVHSYANRGGDDGFRAEVEFDGTIYSYDYNDPMPTGRFVQVATVSVHNGTFSIEHKIPCNESLNAKELWNIHTMQFVPVSVIMYSPNFWDEQTGRGHKHLFFMLKDCINPENPNGFYNEFIRHDIDVNKRLLAALGTKMKVESVDEQLSGVGFSTTKRGDILVKVTGQSERILRVKF